MGNENNNNNEQQPVSRWGRLGKAVSWAVNSAIRLIILVLLLAVLTGAVWLGLQEMDRSLSNIVRRLNTEEQKVAQLQVDVERLGRAHGEQARQTLALETTVSGYDRRITAVEQQLAADRAAQNARLADLEAQLTAVISATTQNSDNLATLSRGLNALQGDLNANVGELDELGGQLDEAQTVLANLALELADLREEFASPESEAARLQQVVALYRVSELISRSRLRLVEGNAGLALLDVRTALTAVEDLIATGSPAFAEALVPVQTRLALAAANLPADPLEASRDLESAWERLDGMIAVLIVPAASPDDFAFEQAVEETTVEPAAPASAEPADEEEDEE
jgi:predicted  nucleic acid-binding Zn-ribbon protein